MTLSPTGKVIVPSSGPLDAELVFIGESPAAEEVRDGIPFVGKAGRLLNKTLVHVGINRAKVRLINLVPVRAPGDKFAKHDPVDIEWGRANLHRELGNLPNARVYVPLGANPTQWLLGKLPTNKKGEEGFIGQWRGSVIPAVLEDGIPEVPEDYLQHLPVFDGPKLNANAVVIPTFHPAAILRQYNWHPWFVTDLRRAAAIIAGDDGVVNLTYRKWYWQNAAELRRLAASGIDLISYDTEMDPAIVAIATEDEVHVFEYNESFREPLTSLLTSPRILKVAHNWTHDYAWTRVKFGITVARPYFDTQGAAHILNNALQKELSPHIATRYTNWPYHKWLTNHDPMLYCGMDAVVCYDAYWPQLRELVDRDLYGIADHDHKLLTLLMKMQEVGFRVNEGARADVEKELAAKLAKADGELQQMVEPVIAKKLHKFEKPHLFQVDRKCTCCGGGKLQREHCTTCLGMSKDPENRVDWGEALNLIAPSGYLFRKWTIKQIREIVPGCMTCKGTGKVIKKLPFNSDSPDQLADVIYRGLGIRARKFKGKETTKAANLDPIKDQHPIVAKIVEVSAARAELDTVSRLTADSHGLLHCVFDPFGTASGRVAGKEGLVELGTNPMNIPLEARRLVVPREGKVFLYPDMAQIEARVAAVLSKDKNLIAAFNEPVDWPGHEKHGKIDSHTKVQQLFDKQGVKITRDQAKRFTYAGIFGGGAAQLAVELNAEAFRKGEGANTLTTEQVQRGLDTFFLVFNGLRKWQNDVVDEVIKSRKLRNPLTGREFTWTGYLTKQVKYTKPGDTVLRSAVVKGKKVYEVVDNEVKKQIWSRLPQDTAAYVLALGLIDIYYNTDHWGDLLQPLIHVHDAPLIEAPVERLEEAKAEAIRLLTKDLWGIRFEVSMKTGMDWYTASGGTEDVTI